MKRLQHFKNIHKGKDIYVIASGKSIDYIDNSFFQDKITIGINQVYKKLETTYLIRKEYKLIDEVIRNLKDSQYLFISRGNCGHNDCKNLDYILTHYKDSNNIILYNHNANLHKLYNIPSTQDTLVVSYSTITTGIHLAAYMGAKNIILVGHDCGSIDGECNFNGYHTQQTYEISFKNGKKDYIQWLKEIENDTIRLKQILKSVFDCNIYSLNPFINFGLEGHVYTK